MKKPIKQKISEYADLLVDYGIVIGVVVGMMFISLIMVVLQLTD